MKQGRQAKDDVSLSTRDPRVARKIGEEEERQVIHLHLKGKYLRSCWTDGSDHSRPIKRLASKTVAKEGTACEQRIKRDT